MQDENELRFEEGEREDVIKSNVVDSGEVALGSAVCQKRFANFSDAVLGESHGGVLKGSLQKKDLDSADPIPESTPYKKPKFQVAPPSASLVESGSEDSEDNAPPMARALGNSSLVKSEPRRTQTPRRAATLSFPPGSSANSEKAVVAAPRPVPSAAAAGSEVSLKTVEAANDAPSRSQTLLKAFSGARTASVINEVQLSSVLASLKEIKPKLARVSRWDLMDEVASRMTQVQTVISAARSLKAWCIGRAAKNEASGQAVLQNYNQMCELCPDIALPFCFRQVALISVDLEPRLRKIMFVEAAAGLCHRNLVAGFEGSY